MALWAAENGTLWAQRISRGARVLTTVATKVGQLTTGTAPIADQPIAIALPSGDLALVGLLANGRISFARGSAVDARRLMPKVAIPTNEREVLGLDAAANGENIDLIIVRGPAGYESISRKPPESVEIELVTLGPSGESTGASLRWQTRQAYAPRIARCGNRQYLAWRSMGDVVVSSVSPDGERSAERLLSTGRGSVGKLARMFCQGGEAWLAASWKRDQFASENANELAFVKLTEGAARLAWQKVKLPGPTRDVLLNDGSLAAYGTATQLLVEIQQKKTFQFVRVDLQTRKVALPSLVLPWAHDACLPLSHGTGAVCGNAVRDERATACPNLPSRVDLTLLGETGTAPAAALSAGFWTYGSIADADAPSAAACARRAKRVYCGDADWNLLRDALATWCASEAKADPARVRDVYCASDKDYSLLYQATTCTNLPLECAPSKLSVTPSVDRAEFDRGQHIEFSYMNCSVWFARDGATARVVDRECSGE
jgi:hypothetical protein